MVGQVSQMLLVISVTCYDPISAQVNIVVQPVVLSLALGLHLANTGVEAHSFSTVRISTPGSVFRTSLLH